MILKIGSFLCYLYAIGMGVQLIVGISQLFSSSPMLPFYETLYRIAIHGAIGIGAILLGRYLWKKSNKAS